MKFRDEEELLEYAKGIIGKTFRELDDDGLLENQQNKGVLGHVVEKGFFGYEPNSNPVADFEELGIELKVTGYVKNKNGKRRAKERLVLSMIDYKNIINETFDFSKLIFKNKKLLIIWYQYDKDLDGWADFEIKYVELYDMEEDIETFKKDFQDIQQKVQEGKAHELSEGATKYLGACTKSSTSKVRREQPNSDIPAKPRAFSLKNQYMNKVLNEIDFDEQKKWRKKNKE